MKANTHSSAYLMAGFDNRMVHFKNHGDISVKITMEIDFNGDNNWKAYKSISLEKEAYAYHLFDQGLKANWIRLVFRFKFKVNCNLSFYRFKFKKQI